MLWLIFKDEGGEEQRIEMDRDTFTIGRHSACNLTYTDSRLSREHVRLDRDGDRHYVLDLGSSNGTTLNERELSSPIELRDGDVLNLGGGLEIKIEIESSKPDELPLTNVEAVTSHPPAAESQFAASAPTSSAAPSAAEGIPTALFILAPLLGIFVLAIIVGAVILIGGSEKEVANTGDGIGNYSENDDSDELPDREPTPTPVKTSSPLLVGTPANGTTPISSPGTVGTELPPSGRDLGETAKIEQNGASFLRQIAQNDPRAFLTGEQAAKVNAKVKQIGKSSLSDNLNSARKNASAIKALASSKNLKPQFLAVAAITKLGGNRGDVLQTAQSIVDVYDKLGIQIGNENSDDALLMVAAYDQGVTGDTMKMRNMLQAIAEAPGSPGTREIRSIWYLQKNNKITSAEFERALTFLAIGTVAQNPKDYGVNTEALKL